MAKTHESRIFITLLGKPKPQPLLEKELNENKGVLFKGLKQLQAKGWVEKLRCTSRCTFKDCEFYKREKRVGRPPKNLRKRQGRPIKYCFVARKDRIDEFLKEYPTMEDEVLNKEEVINYLAKSKDDLFFVSEEDFEELICMLKTSKTMKKYLMESERTLEDKILALFHEFLVRNNSIIKIRNSLGVLLKLPISVLPSEIKRRLLYLHSLQQDLVEKGYGQHLWSFRNEFWEINKTSEELKKSIIKFIDFISSEKCRVRASIKNIEGSISFEHIYKRRPCETVRNRSCLRRMEENPLQFQKK